MEKPFEELLAKPTLTVAQVATLLGANHKTIRAKIAAGELQVIKLGRTMRVPTSTVRELLAL